MSSPFQAVADRGPFHAGASTAETTVYLRREPHGWSVSLDEALLLVSEDEETAFQRACEARLAEGGAPLRMMILSGPFAASPVPDARRRGTR